MIFVAENLSEVWFIEVETSNEDDKVTVLLTVSDTYSVPLKENGEAVVLATENLSVSGKVYKKTKRVWKT